MRGNEACDQNRNADRERTAANTKKLIEVALEKVGAIGEISGEGFAKLSRRFRLSFAIRDMDDDVDRLVGSQFARPTDDVFLHLSVEIALAKRKWVEAVKQLSDRVDAKLNGLGWDCRCHFVPVLDLSRSYSAGLQPNQGH